MQTKMIEDLAVKFFPTTIMLNVGAIGVGMSETEKWLKIVSYGVAIIWTILKIIQQIRQWKK